MKNILSCLILICFSFSCRDKPINYLEKELEKKEISDSCCVINQSYKKGDVRRYGVFPNEKINKEFLKNCMSLANSGLPLFFVKGTYDTPLILNGVSDVELNFDDAIITGSLEIVNQDSIQSKNIVIKGKLTVLDKLFIRHSKNVSFDKVLVISDTLNSRFHKKNRGVSIYVGSETIKFNNLFIKDTGGGSDDFYKHSAAAFQVHGWNNNPKNITIQKIEIVNAARTAMYLTGFNHKISKTIISDFGSDQYENMFGLEDVKEGYETDFSGVWINKCDDCVLDSLSISNTSNKGKYSINFGIGSYSNPTFINNINFKANAEKMPMKDDPLTNILVKSTY